MNERIKSLDFAKGIAIIAVTFAHNLGSLEMDDLFIYKYLCSFELFVFFFINGMIIYLKNYSNQSLKHYSKKQFKSLMIPYYKFSAIILLIDIIVTLPKGVNKLLLIICRDIIYSILNFGLGAIWFLPSLFFANLIVFSINKKYHYKGIIICVLALIGICIGKVNENLLVTYKIGVIFSELVLNILGLLSRVLIGASIIYLGMQTKRIYEQIKERVNKKYYIYIYIIIGIVTAYFNYDFIDIHFGYVRNPILFYISGLSTSIAILLLGQLIEIKFISWCGKNSMLLILCQTFAMYICIVENKFFKFNNINDAMGFLVTIIITLMTISIGWIISTIKYKKEEKLC